LQAIQIPFDFFQNTGSLYAMKFHPAPLLLTLALATPALAQPEPAAESSAAPEKIEREFMTEESFDGRNLEGTDFHWVRMNEATFKDGLMSGATFNQCDLSTSDLRGAQLGDSTSFHQVLMNNANLEGLDLMGADFEKVNLRGANLRNTKNFGTVSKTTFDGADLRGADLSSIPTPLVEVTFKEAIYDENTRFPEGVDPAAAGAKPQP
jgi:uncharacterized protein YjbI with pentapeptide repeats